LGGGYSSTRNWCTVKTTLKNEENDVTAIYGRKLEERRSKFAIEFSRGVTLIDGDRSAIAPNGMWAWNIFNTKY
jgi:curli production assembly/transport component CsgG